jgi:hypothetical protein
MSRYIKVHDNEWQMPILEGYKMACCDCGLVHNINFKIVKEDNVDKEIKGARVILQATRNTRATGQVRRHKNKKP